MKRKLSLVILLAALVTLCGNQASAKDNWTRVQSKNFTLVYNLPNPEAIYQRFPGLEGTAYFVAGIGVNYQQSGRVVLAPMRTGVGLRAGVNGGYLSYAKERNWIPF